MELVIIGVQKAGTTYLKEYLMKHPNVHIHVPEEIGYFLTEDRSWDVWYRKNYLKRSDEVSVLAAKSVDIFVDEKAKQKLKDEYPEARIVVVLRDPIDRIESAINYCISRGYETERNIEKILTTNVRYEKDVLRKRNCNYIYASDYKARLSELFEIFDKQNVLVLDYEDLIRGPDLVLTRMSEFTGIPFLKECMPVKAVNKFVASRYPAVNSVFLIKGTKLNSLWKLLPVRLRRAFIELVYSLNSTTSGKLRLSESHKNLIRSKIDIDYKKFVE